MTKFTIKIVERTRKVWIVKQNTSSCIKVYICLNFCLNLPVKRQNNTTRNFKRKKTKEQHLFQVTFGAYHFIWVSVYNLLVCVCVSVRERERENVSIVALFFTSFKRFQVFDYTLKGHRKWLEYFAHIRLNLLQLSDWN